MVTSKGTGFKWDAESERDLFGACLVVLGEPKGKILADAHQLLVDTRGVTYTPKAAQHRMLDNPAFAHLTALLDHLDFLITASSEREFFVTVFLLLDFDNAISNRLY